MGDFSGTNSIGYPPPKNYLKTFPGSYCKEEPYRFSGLLDTSLMTGIQLHRHPVTLIYE